MSDIDFFGIETGFEYVINGTGRYTELSNTQGWLVVDAEIDESSIWKIKFVGDRDVLKEFSFPRIEVNAPEERWADDERPPEGDCFLLTVVAAPAPVEVVRFFRRGDVLGDGRRDISDCIFMLSYLFLSGEEPGCMDSADVNDDGQIDLSDPTSLLRYLFQGSATVWAPWVFCGTDVTDDGLNCGGQQSCIAMLGSLIGR